eukprot:Lankesteria_metandrocarpae@DN9631_c0_g1_i1.p1
MPIHKKGQLAKRGQKPTPSPSTPLSVPSGVNLILEDDIQGEVVTCSDNEEDSNLVTEEEFVDPFSFDIASEAYQFRRRFGILHNDYQRYRHFCSRRIHKLRHALHFQQGRRKYTKRPLPDKPTDRRHLLLALLLAERAWAFGTELQLENAQRGQISFALRRKSQSKYRQATCRAHELLSMCLSVGDDRTQLEAKAYQKWLLTVWLTEREMYLDALRCSEAFSGQYKLLLDLTAPTETHSIASFRQQMEESETLTRICRYHLNRHGIETRLEGSTAGSSTATGKPSTAGHQFSWRGVNVHAPSDAAETTHSIKDCEQSLKTVCARQLPALDSKNGNAESSIESSADLDRVLDRIREEYSDPIRSMNEHLHWLHEEVLRRTLLHGSSAAVDTSALQIGNSQHKALVVPHDAVSRECLGGIWMSQSWMGVEGYLRDAVQIATIQRELELLHACFRILLRPSSDTDIGGVLFTGSGSNYTVSSTTGKKGSAGTERRSRLLTIAALSGAQQSSKETENALTHMAEHAQQLCDSATGDAVSVPEFKLFFERVVRSTEMLISNLNALSGVAKDMSALCTAIGLHLNGKLAPSYVLLQYIEERMSDREVLSVDDKKDAMNILSPLMKSLGLLQDAATHSIQLLKVNWIAAVAHEEEANRRAVTVESKRRFAAATLNAGAATDNSSTTEAVQPDTSARTETRPCASSSNTWLIEPASKLVDSIQFPPAGFTIPCKPVFFDLAINRFEPPHKGQELHEVAGTSASVVGKLKSWWLS